MNPWKWGLVALIVFGALTTVASIGKPRPTITPRTAVIVLLLNAAQVFAVVQS